MVCEKMRFIVLRNFFSRKFNKYFAEILLRLSLHSRKGKGSLAQLV